MVVAFVVPILQEAIFLRPVKLFVVTVLFVFMAVSQAVWVEAAQPPVLKVGSVTAAPGAVVTVPVNLISQGEVAGIQFEISYDTGLLTYMNAAGGELAIGYLVKPAKENGKVKLLIANLDGAAIPGGNGTVAQITFRVSGAVKSGQSCALDIGGVLLSDAQGRQIAARVNAGSFNAEIRKVNAYKTWTIRFNAPVDSSTVNESIMVTDASGNRQSVIANSSSDGTSVTVALPSGASYRKGQTYTLALKTSLRSASGEYLKNPVFMQFTIE